MRERIKNTLHVEVEGIDLTTVRDIELYVRQGRGFRAMYRPQVLSATELLLVIPYEDAMQLSNGASELQLAFVDAGGTPRASEPTSEDVGRLIWEEGYAP